jgi:hypothetical protein
MLASIDGRGHDNIRETAQVSYARLPISDPG